MTNAIEKAQQLGQSIWYDNIRRGLIRSGELQRLIDLGVTGLTSNPTMFQKVIAGSTDYDETLLQLLPEPPGPQEVIEALTLDDIQATADLLQPVYHRTSGADGYVSLDVSPSLSHDTEGTIVEARRLFGALDRANVMVKVPATPAGISAVRSLIGSGINVNVTLIFSLDTYEQVAEAYIAGLEELYESGGDVGAVASVASFLVSRVDSAVDALLEEDILNGREDLKPLLGKAAIANARLAYKVFQGTFNEKRFAYLEDRGARVQRPLWYGTGTRNPSYSDMLYVEGLIGPDTVNAMPEATLAAFLEHGEAVETIDRAFPASQRIFQLLAEVGISMESVAVRLLADGLQALSDSYDKLMDSLEDRQVRLQEHKHSGISIGGYLPEVEGVLSDLQRRNVMRRIWRRDHTVWNSKPTEITNRLGWLTVADLMVEQIPELEAFAAGIRDAGFRHVVLVGMGGSSLGPEVLQQTFGSSVGHPELIVLDSTVATRVQAVSDAIDTARTIFLVSSKSGSTLETNALYAHFRRLVNEAVTPSQAGGHFVAITDPETSLEKLAREEGFRRVFLNPPEIGGRYSVLSYFGLVPAALIGLDLDSLLNRADCMREGSAFCVSAHDNPGAWLGAVIGTIAQHGRDKLTLVTSPSIGSFGLWAEQLIAESTGKEGGGIVPVTGEPVASPESYGIDRLFVYLRLDSDDNAGNDIAIEQVKSFGHPVVRWDLRDRYDIGAEFYRWEFAAAVAGSILGIHPFDQPNVLSAKEMTARVLDDFQATGSLPHAEAGGSLKQLLAGAKPGGYLAIMVYTRQTPEVDSALYELRKKVVEKYGIATTCGYGPRCLHSTGQSHKGGPDSGLFLQLMADQQQDAFIPGYRYAFDTLANAQAVGDLEALRALGRRAARVRLGAHEAPDILRLADELD